MGSTAAARNSGCPPVAVRHVCPSWNPSNAPQALFWAGESYRMGRDIPNAFRRYNRCRWDFPESDAAKYSRGRLALPELLSQFEKEANLNE